MITINKAIEIAEHWQKGGDITSFDDVNQAIKLLIEAGKRIEVGRNNPGTKWNDLLPGETEE